MTDLVKELRSFHWHNDFGDLGEKAATEIERLQAENERLNKQIANMNHAAHAYDGRLEELQARIELLEKVVEATEKLVEVTTMEGYEPGLPVTRFLAVMDALNTLWDTTATPESREPPQ